MLSTPALSDRVLAAMNQQNQLKESRWDDAPPHKHGLAASARSVASRELRCLYQLSLELEAESHHIDQLDVPTTRAYQQAITAVSSLMGLRVDAILDDPDHAWVITEDGWIHEYHDLEPEVKSIRNMRSRPAPRLVFSKT